MSFDAVTVTIVMFMAGVVFQLGRFSARLERLEEWRNEHREELDRIHAALRRIEEIIQAR